MNEEERKKELRIEELSEAASSDIHAIQASKLQHPDLENLVYWYANRTLELIRMLRGEWKS